MESTTDVNGKWITFPPLAYNLDNRKKETTALHVECSRNEHDKVERVCKLLESVGCNIKNNFGETALHLELANKTPNYKVVKLLLENKANAIDTEMDKKTCLHVYCSNRAVDLEILKLLVESVGVLDIGDREKRTPLLTLCLNPSATVELVEFMISRGSSLLAVEGYHKRNCLQCACSAANLPLIKYFIEKKNFNVFIVDFDSMSAFRNLIHSSYLTSRKENTLLHILCSSKDPTLEALKYLLSFAFEIDELNEYEHTPLLLACNPRMNFEVISTLMREGASVLRLLEYYKSIFSSSNWRKNPLFFRMLLQGFCVASREANNFDSLKNSFKLGKRFSCYFAFQSTETVLS